MNRLLNQMILLDNRKTGKKYNQYKMEGVYYLIWSVSLFQWIYLVKMLKRASTVDNYCFYCF